MHVRMSLRVDWKPPASFASVQDVVVRGAGPVERNIVARITILRRGRNLLTPRTITMASVAVKRQDSTRKTIVLVVIQDIVENDGREKVSNASSRWNPRICGNGVCQRLLF